MQNNRLSELKKYLSKNNIDAYFVADILDISYLTGFTGSTAYLLVTEQDQIFFTDGRYQEQSAIELDNTIFEIKIVERYTSVIDEELQKFKSIMIEPNTEVSLYDTLRSKNLNTKINIDTENILLKLRMIKDNNEIALIAHQYEIAGTSFLSSLSSFRSGVTERSWAASLSFNMLNNGADGESFDTIVASGVRASLPHGRASDKIVNATDPVIVDFGTRSLYNSDYTRMVYSGNDADILSVIDIVRVAMLKAIDFAKSGVNARDVDNIARDYISSKGYARYFNHSLGHGVGLNVHELPNINMRSDIILENGMIFTIEPGIYLPNKFGVRIEESILIRDNSVEVISSRLKDYVYKMA